jgi:hypothetical protein
VIALEIDRDLLRGEVVVLAELMTLLITSIGGSRTIERPPRAVSEAVDARKVPNLVRPSGPIMRRGTR